MEKGEGEGGGIEFENFHRYGCLRAMETGDISIIRKRYAHRFPFRRLSTLPYPINFFVFQLYFPKEQ